MKHNVLERETTYYYHSIPTHYNPQQIHDAYMVDIGEMDETDFKEKYPGRYYGKVIKYFEDEMFSLCTLSRTEYQTVKGINLNKDGIYIEDFNLKMFVVIIDGQIALQIEK